MLMAPMKPRIKMPARWMGLSCMMDSLALRVRTIQIMEIQVMTKDVK